MRILRVMDEISITTMSLLQGIFARYVLIERFQFIRIIGKSKASDKDIVDAVARHTLWQAGFDRGGMKGI